MSRKPQRTCIGCRSVFNKDEVVRIAAGPAGVVIDYRERLPGRAAYICPRRECIERALAPGKLGKSLRTKMSVPTVDAFVISLVRVIQDRICSILAVAAKAGKIATGFSAVEDALGKRRVSLLLYASDLSGGTRDKVVNSASGSMPLQEQIDLTTSEMGKLVGRELVGVIGIVDPGFAEALHRESKRLKGLINTHA